GEGGGHAVIDIGAQRVERHAPFAIPLHARDLRSAQASRAIDANAAGTEPHGRLHRTFHGAPERHATLKLLRDRFGDQLRVELGLADLDDVDDDVGLGELGDLPAQFLYVGTFLTDHDSWPRRLNGDAALLVRPLDHDLRHRGLLE